MFMGISGTLQFFFSPGFVGLSRRAPDYESGGREFESLRARHFEMELGMPKPVVLVLEARFGVTALNSPASELPVPN